MSVHRAGFTVAMLLLALVGCGPALPPAGNYATVSGQVVDASSGKGIANASVSINGGVLSALTDASGNFKLTPVPSGDWDYTASASGYGSTGLITSVPPLSPGEKRTVSIPLKPS